MDKRHKEVKWYEKLDETADVQEKSSAVKTVKKSAIKKDLFDQNIKDTYEWIDLIASKLGLEERPDTAWNILREVMHIIRDRITINEVLHLSAQLPVLIRGMYFEGYSISAKPRKFHVDEVEERIRKALMGTTGIEAQKAFGAVLTTLYNRVSEGELNDIRGTLPKDIREYWDESVENSEPIME
ncbi:DUF2267 domain-containing protein [Gracilimonas tropica]|uniref:DUF2267 domain-containing protein n=1 Tax=Gracilimonas tropica TaxID=454600 RepID=UPI00037D087F|nr:DUF2267 domain-containing protein [Gracilimonas tropica]